jgi:hypothetical protein
MENLLSAGLQIHPEMHAQWASGTSYVQFLLLSDVKLSSCVIA